MGSYVKVKRHRHINTFLKQMNMGGSCCSRSTCCNVVMCVLMFMFVL